MTVTTFAFVMGVKLFKLTPLLPKTIQLMKKIITAMALALASTSAGAQNETTMENVLDNRQQHLVTIANLEAKGDLANLAEAINNALDDTLSVSEVKEAFSQLYAYTGFPRSLNALNTLQRVVADRAEAGTPTREGKDADALPADYDALVAGTKVQSQLTGRSYKYEFAPATDYYLKAHLFGDIFARNNLSYADRELVTIGALSGIEGVEPQLKSHVSGARNMGLTEAQIAAIPAVLAANVGAAEAQRARRAISEVFGYASDDELPVLPFAIGSPNTAYAQYFIGNSYLANLATGDGKLPVNNVTFEPGCRNNWHTHHGFNQILIVVSGSGWYQEWGKPAQSLKPGDVVDIPAGVKHWHGAATDSWFQHIALSTPATDGRTEWQEPVTDEEYAAVGK